MSLDSPQESDDQEAALWNGLKASGAREIRDQLVKLHARLARSAAIEVHRKVRGMGVELSDLTQLASKGLIEAVDRFDPAKGVRFAAFARKRIKGAIYNDLPKESELAAQLAYQRDAVRDRAQSIKVKSTDTFSDLVEAAVGLAIGFMLEDSGMFHGEKTEQSEEEAYGRTHELRYLREELRLLLESLPISERQVIRYHYLDGQSFTDIAARLHVTKARISQLHRAGVKRLQQMRRQRIAAVDVSLK